MTKLAQAAVIEATGDSLSESSPQGAMLRLKRSKEAEIRKKLDVFARELAQARADRRKR